MYICKEIKEMEPITKKCKVDNRIKNKMGLEDLPDHLIHQIMHLLPYEEAVKFSVLSKPFYSSWLSFPTLDFCYKSTSSDDDSYQTFFSIVQKTLQLRGPYIKGSLHKLNLSYMDMHRSNSHPQHYPEVFDELLNYAVKTKVKELNFDITGPDDDVAEPDDYLVYDSEDSDMDMDDQLAFDPEDSDLEDMNETIVNVNYDSLHPLFSSPYLTVLKLTGVKFSSVDVFITCPKLKELLFKSCDGFQSITVSSASSSLKKFEVKWCRGLKALQILKVKSLQSFKFEVHELEVQRCTLDISDCPSLRVFKLIKAATIMDEWLNQTIQGLHYLEELEIRSCNMLEKMIFENYSLKKFSLHDCLGLKEVVVDVPNLLEFNYSGIIWYPISILSAKCSGSISSPYGSSNLFVLKRFLKCFDHFKELSLCCFRFEYMIFARQQMLLDNLSPLYHLRHLKLEARDSPLPSGQTLIKLLESLLWLTPKPRTITFYSRFTKTVSTLKFEYGREVKKMGECCHNVSIKCWKHYEVKIEFQGFDESMRGYLKKFFARKLRYNGFYRDS